MENLWPPFLGKIRAGFELITYLERLDVGAYIVDVDRNILFWNSRATQITGYTASEVVGKSCRENILQHTDQFGVPLCSTKLCPLYQSIQQEKFAILPFSVNALRKDHTSRVPLDVIAFPLYLGDVVVGGMELFQKSSSANEMAKAMDIQKALIPTDLPHHVHTFFHPSSQIGGDMIFWNDSWMALLDVNGHGLSSALISTSLVAILKDILTPPLSIGELGYVLEERFRLFGDTERYFTGIFAKVKGAFLELVSFGHPLPLLKGPLGVETLPVPIDFPIGWDLGEHSGESMTLELCEGQSLLVYSDGIIDIPTRSGRLGVEGLSALFREEQSLEELYVRAREQDRSGLPPDDITLLRFDFPVP